MTGGDVGFVVTFGLVMLPFVVGLFAWIGGYWWRRGVLQAERHWEEQRERTSVKDETPGGGR